MNRLEALKAALEAAIDADRAVREGSDRGTEGADRRATAWNARRELANTLTDDTIASLVAVAEAAGEDEWCPVCNVQQQPHGDTHRPGCALATLVEEETDDRA